MVRFLFVLFYSVSLFGAQCDDLTAPPARACAGKDYNAACRTTQGQPGACRTTPLTAGGFCMCYPERKAAPLDPAFFANESFVAKFPGATVLHGDAIPFLEESSRRTFDDARALVTALHGLEVLDFPKLSYGERIDLMKEVFRRQVEQSGLPAPALVLDDNAVRSTFFDFDPKHPSPGKVILNPKKLFADSNPYAALLFLVHETRHSFQFQVAYTSGPFAKTLRAGFEAQKQVFEGGIKTSFCDFLTLSQEYEAFLFGNIVLEELTNGAVDTSDMGTFASQYVPGQGLRIDLPALARKVGAGRLLAEFNLLEEAQYKQ